MAEPFFENAAHRGATDREFACDGGFANPGAKELSHLLRIP